MCENNIYESKKEKKVKKLLKKHRESREGEFYDVQSSVLSVIFSLKCFTNSIVFRIVAFKRRCKENV